MEPKLQHSKETKRDWGLSSTYAKGERSVDSREKEK